MTTKESLLGLRRRLLTLEHSLERFDEVGKKTIRVNLNIRYSPLTDIEVDILEKRKQENTPTPEVRVVYEARRQCGSKLKPTHTATVRCA